MRVVITGATGCVGRSLIKLLNDFKIPTLVLLHKKSSRNEGIVSSEYIKTDYCDVDEYSDYSSSELYDVFIHMAWVGGSERNNVDLHYKNVEYAINALKLAKRMGCKRFVFTGSQAECGVVQERISCNTNCNPVNAFGASKLYTGYMTRFLANQIGIEHIWCRILSVYGPCDRMTAMVPSVLKKFLANEEVSLTKCEQKWDFIYCDDAAEAVFLCAQNGVKDKIYPIGSGDVRELNEFINVMRDKTHSNSEMIFGAIPYSDNQVMFLGADIDELTKDTGFRVKTSFEDGILKTINWLRSI